MAALRATLKKPAWLARDTSASCKSRDGTKQQQVLALLRQPEDATVAQIPNATDWSTIPPVVFASLKKRQSIAVEVLGGASARSAEQARCKGQLHHLPDRRSPPLRPVHT
jgi:hypothetical protein